MMIKRMIFLGPPGAGKGTHAGMIAEHYGIPKISTGEILRGEVKAGTELGRKAEDYISSGELVPDDIVIGMLKTRLASEGRKGFILDGYPRTLEQARALDRIESINLVVNMKVSKKTIMARITNRWTCRNCQAIYNTLFVKPRKEGICDRCGSELYQREDQKPEVVEDRLRVYEEQTAPLIEHYRKKGVLMDVSSEGEKEVVHRRILAAVREFYGEKA
jgi:adenylate kinase